MENSQRNTFLFIGAMGLLGLTQYCRTTETQGGNPAPEIQDQRGQGSAILRRIFEPAEDGLIVDMTPYLDEEGALKKDFSPSRAIADCMRRSDPTAIETMSYGGHFFFFPARIEIEAEGVYPVELYDDHSYYVMPEDGDVKETVKENQRHSTVGRAIPRNYTFDLNDLDASTQAVKAACQYGLDQLKETHDLEDFCGEIEDELPGDIACESTKQRWEAYAEWGRTIKSSNDELAITAKNMGFQINLGEGGTIQIEDDFDGFEVYRNSFPSPGLETPSKMGYQVVRHVGDSTYVEEFQDEDETLEFLADPEATREKRAEKKRLEWENFWTEINGSETD